MEMIAASQLSPIPPFTSVVQGHPEHVIESLRSPKRSVLRDFLRLRSHARDAPLQLSSSSSSYPWSFSLNNFLSTPPVSLSLRPPVVPRDPFKTRSSDGDPDAMPQQPEQFYPSSWQLSVGLESPLPFQGSFPSRWWPGILLRGLLGAAIDAGLAGRPHFFLPIRWQEFRSPFFLLFPHLC